MPSIAALRRQVSLIIGLPLVLACTGSVPVEPTTDVVTVAPAMGLNVPESALYDAANDLYLVSNINGMPFGGDRKGFISRVLPNGTVRDLRWIDGAKPGTELNAPKGMAIVGDILFVADVNKVRKFNRVNGTSAGFVAIDQASFLNDVAASASGTVYVSDTGFKLGADGETFEPSQTDAVYAITPDNKVTALVKDAALGKPNGLLIEGTDVLMVTWEKGALERITPDGKIAEVAKLPKNQLDGIVKTADGSYLISSWAGSCIYRVAGQGEITEVVKDLDAPADIGWDTKRTRLLIPYFKGKKLDSRKL